MEYVYDIVLNFQERYYDFYEWLPSDNITNVKKIPIYLIDNKSYLDIKYYKTKIDTKTLSKNNKVFLITSGLEIMGITINKEGIVTKKSSLLYEESDNILVDKESIKKIKIKYQIISNDKIGNESRNTMSKRNYLTKYLKKIDKTKDEYLLKYLYFNIYNREETDSKKIYDGLITLLEKDPHFLYESLKKTNQELKKAFP